MLHFYALPITWCVSGHPLSELLCGAAVGPQLIAITAHCAQLHLVAGIRGARISITGLVVSASSRLIVGLLYRLKCFGIKGRVVKEVYEQGVGYLGLYAVLKAHTCCTYHMCLFWCC